ncbi:acetyl-CoA carboxylase biotin carboxylase subunit [Desulfosudis oleivorans]|uniref:Carbamoyl-phosphate synthase L chain ATP-binding n=1 Tax=Desulfosudis oleivorans (strain DSM 6200 / JCM 39069 / Hxd3) TaxID=96561 RepID=A8ZUF1_DESOH|nr:acetyl-CoA carboxylase biotin carboxylase subunit [Desulfosudis oleivorans]ABW67983.1 Carbamoyl-phosphate synthase L chain ATP-binding [Desulfosudis oleivorans Hxd3]
MFNKILIANRGEIAVRVMATCREMDIATVAVYSDVDAEALHRLCADEAVCIGRPDPADSYLNGAKIIDAAKKTGAQAIHPGYGFLAENAEFAQLCEASGIVFIGPPSTVIRSLGDKTVARQIMAGSGVPVIPGMNMPESDFKKMAAHAEIIGYPVLVKAAAGGGGKGMRIVTDPAHLSEALAAASGEAAAAFGNGAIYLEKYIARPRHVEIQVLADRFGHTVHLGERECSIQRRHQKIIEETPSTALTPDLREAMGRAAVQAAEAAGYVNAGTVEFLVDEQKNFYFLEVNTRLQVEHPITELVTGIDLVRRQIEIAAGEKLDLVQKDIQARGHAIECRIYAEDPENNFMPSPGRIALLEEPRGPGIRNDCGVYAGFTVPMEYDPILSKLVVHAGTRQAAIDRMKKALSDYRIAGIRTPISFLMEVVDSAPFRNGETFTDFLDTHFSEWKPAQADNTLAALAFIAHTMWARTPVVSEPGTGTGGNGGVPSPWQTLGHWRL